MNDIAETLTAPDGRTLSYLEVGNPQGPPVVHNHGGPSSRLEARLLAAAASRNGLRLICADRPGMDALGGALVLRLTPAFRLMYATLNFTASHLRYSFVKEVRKTGNDYDQPILNRLVRDAGLLCRRWAFDVREIERPVHLWQGLDDLPVPDSINRAVADAMPGAAWHPVEGAGHFIAVGSGDEVFGIAAEDLAAR